MDDSSNRRKTRSSGRKKASTKVADNQDSNQIPDGAEAKSKSNGASPGRSSPEPDCAICLGRLQNKSFTDRCFHMFCFVCLQEWSKVKAECPLCKQKFTSIIHNVRSNEDYDQYPIPPKIPSWEEQARNFRYHTTLTLERRLQINIPDFRQHPQYQEHDYTLQRPSLHNHMTTRSHWRRQRQASSSDFRRRIYTNNLSLVEVTDPRMRTRDTTPSFFRSNPACTHRLVPWLNRELNALLQGQHEHVQFVLELIMDRIKSVAITSEEFYQSIYPYMGRYTRHFMHEFEHFARSPYNIAAYDQHAVYQPQTLAVESDSDTDSILSVGNDNDDNDDDDDVIVISPSQETGRRRQPSPPHRQRERGSLTYRDLSPLLHRVRSLLEYPDSSHLSVNTPGWDSPTPGPSWAAETEAVDETVLEDGHRTIGNAHAFKTEDERDIDVENSRSNSSSDDSDSDSSKAGSDIVFVGYDRPWQERSPILLLSSSDDNDNAPQSTANSALDSKSKHRDDKKSKTDRHKKRDSELSKNRWRSSKRRRSRSWSWSRSRSRSRSSPRHESYWRRRSHSRSRSKYVSGHHRRRSRSRERSGSKRKRISSPSSLDQSFTYNRSRSSLLSWDQKRHRSKSSSVEITYVKRKKSKHKKKEKKHHKKHKSRKHKKRRRTSDSEDSQASKTLSASRPRSSVTVVKKSQESPQKSEDLHGKENKTPNNDNSTNSHHSSTLQPDSSKTSSAKTTTPDSKSLGPNTITESPDSKVISIDSSDSKVTDVESNINKKPYKKHPTGHKKSSQNKVVSQCTSGDQEHNSSDSAQPSSSFESFSPAKNGNMSGASSQSTESSDRDINGQAPSITDQEKSIKECHIEGFSPSAVQCSLESGGDGLDTRVGDHSSGNMSVPDGKLEIQKDGIGSNVADEENCFSDNSCENGISGTVESCTEFQPNTNNISIHQTLIPASALVESTSNGKDSNHQPSDCSADENVKKQCELQGKNIPPVLSSNAESTFITKDDGTDSCEDTTGKYRSSPCVAIDRGASTPQLTHQTSTIEILDSDSSLSSDSDNELIDCEESVESDRCNDLRRSCVIVTSPQNAASGYPSDSATDYPRYSSEQEISSSAMSEANILANSNPNISQPSSPCLYSSPNIMYSSPMGTNLAIPGFNSLFHSSSASIMRTDSFVSNMSVSISTASVQSQHMTNHVYRASPGGQWESHHSAHSISRANMGNVELVQTMSGVAHNNLYGSTCSATSSTMAYIPRTTCGTCIPNASSIQTYTNMEQSYNHNVNSNQQHVPATSQTLVIPNTSSQTNCPPNRTQLPNEDNSQISLSSLPSYYTSPSSSSLWSHDRHIEVADSSEGDADVDVLYLSDNEDELREINIMDVTDDDESFDDESHVVDLGSVDLISDDSDVEIEETSGPTDSVCQSMIRSVLPHGSVSEAVLEDDAERSRRTTCDLSVCVSDEEDTAHNNGHLTVCSSSEEDSNLFCGANVNGKVNVSSNQKTLCIVNNDNNDDYIAPSSSTVNYQNTSVIDSYEGTVKQIPTGSSSDCHHSTSELDKPLSSDSDVCCHNFSSDSDKSVSSYSSCGSHDASSRKYTPSNENNTEMDVDDKISNLLCSYNRISCEVLDKDNDMCDSSEKHDKSINSMCGSSDNEDHHIDCGSPENKNQNIESVCGSSDNEDHHIDCGSPENKNQNIESVSGSSDNEDHHIDCGSPENKNQNIESVCGSSDNEDHHIDCGSPENKNQNIESVCGSSDNEDHHIDCGSPENKNQNIESVCGSSDNEGRHIDCGSPENKNQNIESVCSSSDNEGQNINNMCGSSDNKDRNVDGMCGSSEHNDRNANSCISTDSSLSPHRNAISPVCDESNGVNDFVEVNEKPITDSSDDCNNVEISESMLTSGSDTEGTEDSDKSDS